jgi:chromosome partitioning protein
MTTIAFINGKGGSGKTTLAVLVAASLAEAGHSVTLADTDPQETATRWLAEREMGAISLAHEGKEGFTLIDTPPILNSAAVAQAIKRARLVLLVSSPSPADLFTAADTAALIKKMGAETKARLIFNNVQEGTRLSNKLDFMAQKVGLTALKSTVRRRQAYQHAVWLGWSSLSLEARHEIQALTLEAVGMLV